MPADLPRENEAYAGQASGEDPIPLAPGAAPPVHRPQQEAVGRNEPGAYSPNERLMGSDR
jgi:hypothetical protein